MRLFFAYNYEFQALITGKLQIFAYYLKQTKDAKSFNERGRNAFVSYP
jgi:hypothetical protein